VRASVPHHRLYLRSYSFPIHPSTHSPFHVFCLGLASPPPRSAYTKKDRSCPTQEGSLGRPFAQEIMGSLGRKIHLELLYGFTNHRLPITNSLFCRPCPAVAGRSSLVLRGSHDPWDPDLLTLHPGRPVLCQEEHVA
jgi:hypothetical protein